MVGAGFALSGCHQPAEGHGMSKIWVRAALLSCAALAVGPAMANHSWGSYHWNKTGSEVQLDVLKSITSQWNTSVNASISDWNQSSVLSLAGQNSSANAKKCSPIAGKILVCNAAYGPRGWLGIASIWLSNGHISQATTKLNDSYFNTSTYNTPAWRALVACQEVGHDFGLDHQDEGFGPPNLGTCMDYTNDPDGGGEYGPSNMHPNQHDYDQLESIYSHVHAAQTNFAIREVGKPAQAGGPASEAPAGDSPAEWGRAVHNDGQGRPNVFVKDIAPGRKMITHVFWAIGKGPDKG
jgi:hypothetical protein